MMDVDMKISGALASASDVSRQHTSFLPGRVPTTPGDSYRHTTRARFSKNACLIKENG